MNILNENEAIVINSLENLKKIVEILDKNNCKLGEHWRFSDVRFYETDIPFVIVNVGVLKWEWVSQMPEDKYTLIQDTEFIAKHSKNTDMDDVRPPKQDKNMKIVVKKENGLLKVGQTYEVKCEGDYKDSRFTDNRGEDQGVSLSFMQFENWFQNGYIEEVKEVSYAFEDIMPHSQLRWDAKTSKQSEQIQAFAKLTHVRAKILKDYGYSEDWQSEGKSYVVYARYTDDFRVTELDTCNYGLEIDFPTRELAELALQHNQELFKAYLGV